jgi:hypothetical protein
LSLQIDRLLRFSPEGDSTVDSHFTFSSARFGNWRISATIASARRLARAATTSGVSGVVAVAETGGDGPVTVTESVVVMAVLGWE